MSMRLQSAIFLIEDTLLNREGADKVLSILKMEGVWMYAVTGLSREDAEEKLRKSGLSEYFRGILTEEETHCPPDSAEMLERAMRRLRSEQRDTIVFVGRLTALRNAREAGFRAAAVRGAADEAEWAAMRAEADEVVEQYEDFLA